MKKGIKIFLAMMLIYSVVIIGCASWLINGTISSKVIFNKGLIHPTAYIIGKPGMYSSIEKALSVATNGDIVTVIPGVKANYHSSSNPNNPDKVTYDIKKDCEIKPGVTLLIPTDKKNLDTVTNSNTLNNYINSMRVDDRSRGGSYGDTANSQEARYLRTTININDGVTLTNNGTLIVSGYCSGGTNGAGSIGHTSHSYAQIKMGRNAKIVQNNANANLHCYGYISEKTLNNNSRIQLQNGYAHIPFVCNDYKGFHSSFAMTDGAIDKQKCSPFNQFEFPNISSDLVISYNAKIKSYASIWATYTNPNFDKVFPQTIPLVGNSNEYVFQFNDSKNCWIDYKYNPSTKIAKVKFYGGLVLNNFALSIKEGIISVNLNTKNAYLPLSYRFDIELNANANQAQAVYDNMKQRIKLLPGCKMKINNNAILKDSEVIVYSSFYDGGKYNGYSSKYLGGVAYPLKEGAQLILDGGKIESTYLAGTVYGNKANITNTYSTIVSKEPWSQGSSGGVNPPWTIKDFLEINEELQVLPLSDLSKHKIYAGVNTFSLYNSYYPSYNINLDSGTKLNVNKFQKVFVIDDTIKTFKLDFVSNIYKAFNNSAYYTKDKIINYSPSTSNIGVINSTLSISNNRNGVNEFNIQSITLECTTPLIQGQIPLWPTSKINLKANVVDLDKIYNKNIVWKSSDPTIATVDNDGNVTGVALGNVKITATCDGMVGEINLSVINEIQSEKLESIYITDDKGNSSLTPIKGKSYNGNYKSGTDVLFKVNLNPASASYASIKWTFRASGAGRQYVNDSTQTVEVITNVESLTVHVHGGSNATDDTCYLDCEVTGLDGTVFKSKFTLNHKADKTCVNTGTDILMGDGTTKKVEDIKITDVVMCFDHETGEYKPNNLVAIIKHPKVDVDVIKLKFSDGITLEVMGIHSLFDYTARRYVPIMPENINSLVNHEFAGYKDGQLDIKTLVSAEIRHEECLTYMLVTYGTKNFVSENILSADYDSNYFDFDDNLKYVQDSKESDIKKYGIYTYDEWKNDMPYFIFDGFNIKYYKILIGKGLMTEEQIKFWIKFSNSLVESGELEFNPDLM